MLKVGEFTLHWHRHGKRLTGPPEYLEHRYPELVKDDMIPEPHIEITEG